MDENELLEEFSLEALELIDDAETGLLNIDKGESFEEEYNCIFRSFHSLKGASGMMGVDELQRYVHEIETNFQSHKDSDSISKELLDYFLQGVDQMRLFLTGENTNLDINNITYPLGPNRDNDTGTGNLSDATEASKNTSTETEKALSLGYIYLIDDEPDIAEIIGEIVREHGFYVREFVDIKSCLASLEEDESNDDLPHLVISDYNMPEMDGGKLLDYVNKNIEPIPFIFVSGFLDKELLMNLVELGATGFVDKPIDQKSLIQKVSRAVIKSKSLQLIDLSIDIILGNFGELEESLKKNGKTQLQNILKNEVNHMLEQRDIIKKLTRLK